MDDHAALLRRIDVHAVAAASHAAMGEELAMLQARLQEARCVLERARSVSEALFIVEELHAQRYREGTSESVLRSVEGLAEEVHERILCLKTMSLPSETGGGEDTSVRAAEDGARTTAPQLEHARNDSSQQRSIKATDTQPVGAASSWVRGESEMGSETPIAGHDGEVIEKDSPGRAADAVPVLLEATAHAKIADLLNELGIEAECTDPVGGCRR